MNAILGLVVCLVLGYVLIAADLALIEWLAQQKINERREFRNKERFNRPLMPLSKIYVQGRTMYVESPSKQV